ncbi:hypothetical protein ACIA8K_31800 [Catenuloplanes sp. NPDC051500]|uniref:hypothetical protein n=1 Tax=Catenuloplanes sp. NPDC051500 TaxID=3363959 RepID=UPI00379673EC
MARFLWCVALTLLILTAASPAGAAPPNSFGGAGTYRVGRDFQPGVYRATGATACYWHRARNASGRPASILANDIGSGQRIVYIRPSDRVFRTSGCSRWRRIFDSGLQRVSTRTTLPGDGVYLVGADFVPGTYRTVGNTSACYWQRSSSADGAIDTIITNGIAKGAPTVTVDASDAIFSTSRCNPWVRVGP